MTFPARDKPITLDQLREVEGDDDFRFMEIVDGAWARKHEAGRFDIVCERYSRRLGALLRRFVEGSHRGAVYQGDTSFVLAQDANGVLTMRRPDVAFVRTDRMKPDAATFYTQAPDLVIDVVGRQDKPGALHRRLTDYFTHGAEQVWLVYPDTREVVQHLSNGMAHRYGVGLTVLCDDLLPGFALDVAKVFEE